MDSHDDKRTPSELAAHGDKKALASFLASFRRKGVSPTICCDECLRKENIKPKGESFNRWIERLCKMATEECSQDSSTDNDSDHLHSV